MFVLACSEGGSITVGDRLLHVVRSVTLGSALVRVEGESEDILISWDRQVEIFPGVQMSMERAFGYSSRIKFYFNAPREVKVREVRVDSG